MTVHDPRPGQPATDAAAPESHGTGASEALLPERAQEDTDAAWGDYAERDDDRLYRDRPPHWDDF